jgi:DNA-binding transcriptional ArsR family regulator
VDDIHVLQSETLKALGNPRRLEILHQLCAGPVEVATLVTRLGISQSGVSQHLGVMRAAGIIERDRNAPGVRYRLADPDYMEACRLMRGAIIRRLARLAETPAAAEPTPELAYTEGA